MNNIYIPHLKWGRGKAGALPRVLKNSYAIMMLFDRHPEYRTKWGDRHFWARGYFVSTVGNVNEETVRKYIQEQEENDKLEDGRK